MKTYAAILTVALSAILLSSNTAQARWVYVHGPYAHPHVLVRRFEPVLAPAISPLVTPEVVVGPHGHLRYVATL
jgi:hypothetical protein